MNNSELKDIAEKLIKTTELAGDKSMELYKKGLISSYFLIFYSLFRFLLEFFREPDPQIGYLIIGMTMGQILSLFLEEKVK